MKFIIDIQHACISDVPVTDEQLILWARIALETDCDVGELTLRLVDIDEITHLNHHYRKQNKPTNVLAFPSSLPENITLDYPLLGDVIICPDVLKQESITLNKSLTAHWALIVMHGVLHLLGYDHVIDDDAVVMQALEVKLLQSRGFDNPYQD